MASYEKALVALDGSEPSFHALREAFKLGTPQLTVVSVAPAFAGDLSLVGVNHLKAVMREPCETALGKAQELARRAGVPVTTVCAIGEPHEGIVDLAETENCDLIVMGAKGLGFTERALMGSVSRRVIGFTNIDTLIVPLSAQVGWDRLLVATDGSENSRPAVDRGLELAQAYGSEMRLVSVVEVPWSLVRKTSEATAPLLQEREAYLKNLKAQAASLGVACQGVVLAGTPDQAILTLAQEHQVNLIIMGSHGRTGLKRLLMGNVVEKVIGQASSPVLVVRL